MPRAIVVWLAGVIALAATCTVAVRADEVDKAIADVRYGPRRDAALAELMRVGAPAVPRAVARLRALPEGRNGERQRAPILWALIQMGESGRDAVRQLGAVALRDVLSLYRNKNEWPEGPLAATQLMASDFLAFALKALNGPESEHDVGHFAQAVRDLARPSFLGTLTDCIRKGPRPRAMAACAQGLGRVKAVESVEPLIAAMLLADKQLRSAATEALASVGPPSVAPLKAAFRNNSDERSRVAIVRALLSLGAAGGQAVESFGVIAIPSALTAFIEDNPSIEVRRGNFAREVNPTIVRVLERNRSASIGQLKKLLSASETGRQGEKNYRSQAFRLLAELSEPKDPAVLYRAIGDRTYGAAEVALVLIARRGRAEGIRRILDAAERWDLQRSAHEALLALGPSLGPTLVSELSSPERNVAAARVLSCMGDSGLQLLRDNPALSVGPLVAEFRKNAAYSAECGIPQIAKAVRNVATREVLADLARRSPVEQAEGFARVFAVPARSDDLTPIDMRAWTPRLIKMLGQPCNDRLFVPAATALGKMRERLALPGLIGALRSRDHCGSTLGSPSMAQSQATAAAVLGQIGGPEVVRELIRAVDEGGNVGYSAAMALETLGDPEGIRVARKFKANPGSSPRATRQRQGLALLLLILGPVALWLHGRPTGETGFRRPFWFVAILAGGLLSLTSAALHFAGLFAVCGVLAWCVARRSEGAVRSLAWDFSLGVTALGIGFIAAPLAFMLLGAFAWVFGGGLK